MCDPTLIAVGTAAVGGASDILGFMGQRQLESGNRVAANQNFFDRTSTIQRQAVEVDSQDAERQLTEAITQAQEGGRISVTAGEFLSAASQTRLQNATAVELSRDAAVEDRNSAARRDQLGRERRGAELQRQSDIARVQRPSAAALALKLGGRALGGASDYKAMTGSGGSR